MSGSTKKEGTMSSKVRFDATEYTEAHGRKPRGRGAWAFAFDGATARAERGDYLSRVFWSTGTFAEAKKAATAEARKRGASTVWVMS